MTRTLRAQAKWDVSAAGVLTVLGAGRLLDFNAEVLLPRVERVRLVDADPLCAGAWSQLPKPVEGVTLDISGCLDRWAETLGQVKLPWTETLKVVSGHVGPIEGYAAASDAVLSLNVLSQLPVGWQDAVEEYLVKRFGRAMVDERETEWLDAVRPGNRMLVEQHLRALELTGAAHVLVITDLEYAQYTGRKYKRGKWEAEPVSWQEGRWSASAGVRCEVTPALEGVELEAGALQEWMPSYRLVWSESWLWHIAPLGVECRECGTIHRVGAFALKRGI